METWESYYQCKETRCERVAGSVWGLMHLSVWQARWEPVPSHQYAVKTQAFRFNLEINLIYPDLL